MAAVQNLELTHTKVQHYVNKMFDGHEIMVSSWECTPFDYKTPNFTNGGVFRIHGQVLKGGQIADWSMVLKVLVSDPQRNVAEHYNFWRREAFIYESKWLENLPAIINVPKCYGVEENSNGTIWLWIEDISGDNDSEWPSESFVYAANQLGRLNGNFLTGKTVMPSDPWICKGWINSWVSECRNYIDQHVNDYFSGNYSLPVEPIIEGYLAFLTYIDDLVRSLNQLPRVLAHQDFWQKNLFLERKSNGQIKLTAIDWQFISISGIGEDLGRFYGLCMSKRNIPQESFASFKDLLFNAYIEGLRAEGWEGEKNLPLFGFYAATAVRAIWEVPKLLEKINSLGSETDVNKSATESAIDNLLLITRLSLIHI